MSIDQLSTICLSASAAILLLGVILWLILKCRRYLYFNGDAYRNARDSLLCINAEIDSLLSACRHISDEKRKDIQQAGVLPVRFFEKRRYPLPEGVMNALEKYSRFAELAERHELEVDFAEKFSHPFRAMMNESSYVSHSQLKSVLKNAEQAVARLRIDDNFCLSETSAGIFDYRHAEDCRVRHNVQFVEKELRSNREFFDSLANYPLDKQQRECCVVDEDATLVLAGAGSGKTSVIMAKVAYLMEKRNVDSSEILLISFTNKAAGEMTERIEKCLGMCGPKAMTFHKFGLEIIKRFGSKRYDIADEGLLQRVIRSSLNCYDKVIDPDYVRQVVEYFAYYFNPDKSQKHYESLGDKIADERSLDLTTLRVMTTAQDEAVTFSGERVKSREEVLIANYLYLNGIEYEYERQYSGEYEDDGDHRVYRPDFYLPDYDVYIEHYAIDEKGSPPQFFSPADRRKYVDSIEWKRNLHKNADNKYIESFSWWNRKNVLFENLTKELHGHGIVFKPRNVVEIWNRLCANAANRVTEFERLVSAFILLFKSNGFDASRFDELSVHKADSDHDTARQKAFLGIARRVYDNYQSALAKGNAYDFPDMITKATAIVQDLAHGDVKYKYIIVDEYQDATVAQMRLIKTIVEKTDAHVFCVGDDWQSIYRFAGSDISLFTNFSRYFDASIHMKIENTYRNSQELIDIMGRFVMMNPGQTRKALKSNLHNQHPICLVMYSTERDNSKQESGIVKALDAVLKSIVKKIPPAGKKSVLLLGRTKYDEKVLSHCASLKRKGGIDEYDVIGHPEISCKFLTVHKSKGIEGDYVVLLNARNDLLGFPNQIADDPILQLVLTLPDPYEFAEERRLFYVALTRTRNSVYLLVPETSYSPFVDDLVKLGVQDRHMIGSVKPREEINCPQCKKGHLLLRRGAHGEFMGCSNYPSCDYRISGRYTSESRRCPECGNFMVMRYGRRAKSHARYNAERESDNRFWGCANYPYCRHTEPY